MTMSVHDAVEAWQAGEITSRRAMTLTGAEDVMDLYALAETCGVETRMTLLPAEERAAREIAEAVERGHDGEATFGMGLA